MIIINYFLLDTNTKAITLALLQVKQIDEMNALWLWPQTAFCALNLMY